MTTTEPRSPVPLRYGDTTRYGRPRKPVRLLVIYLALSALVLSGLGVGLTRWAHGNEAPRFRSSDSWPTTGQGAYRLADESPTASPNEHPAPIASLAKVMTAYVVLQKRPLHAGADGFTLMVSQADVADTATRRSLDQSLVPVAAGERLSERQALMALLLPSANNVAAMLARAVSGSEEAFVAAMNATARRLGMHDTTYTDPSGFDERTVSTATDQLILAMRVAHDPTLAPMMATRSYPLPVAGVVHNTNKLLGVDGFVGMKTGSDDAAGGCLMFRVVRRVAGRDRELIGVVLGQSGHNLIGAALVAAHDLADALLPR